MLRHTDGPDLLWQVTPDLMCILDKDGCFVGVNPAWKTTLGWSGEDMAGQSYRMFVHPDDIARSAQAFETLVAGNPVLRFENRYRSKEGAYRLLSWVAVPDGEMFYCTARDMTAEQENIDIIAANTAEAALRDEFLAVLGHDLRNPLAAFGSGIRLLRREDLPSSATEVLRQMQGSVGRMTELIENLMDLARVRLGGGFQLQFGSTATLADAIAQVVEELRAIAPQTEFVLDISLDAEVSCDAARIKQVLSNLLGNALTHGAPDEPVRVAAHTKNNRLMISVTNTGETIPQVVMDRLFQPFYRGEVQQSQQGLGLGLYIASQIAKAHGGLIKVDSQAGRTSVTLDIPLARAV